MHSRCLLLGIDCMLRNHKELSCCHIQTQAKPTDSVSIVHWFEGTADLPSWVRDTRFECLGLTSRIVVVSSPAPAESSLRKAVQDRILQEMLGSVTDSTGGGWKVLILDDVTTRWDSLRCCVWGPCRPCGAGRDSGHPHWLHGVHACMRRTQHVRDTALR